jgi:peptide/nickel transport system substrate-binding protein
MLKRTLGFLVLVAAILGTSLVGLSQSYGGTLTAAISADPVGFDPHKTSAYSSFEVLENVYDTLVSVGDDLRPIPALAKTWATSEDGLTWTFNLRENVTFHNGDPLTAQDVKYSLERIMDPDTGSGAAWRLAAVDSITAPDEYTVVIKLKYPYPGLLTKLGGYKGMAIVDKKTVDDGTINTHPVGTGPFMFVEYIPGDRVVLKKNPAYWQDGKPYLDKIVYRIIPDETVRVTSLLTGEVDWIDSVPPQRISELQDNPSIVVGQTSGTSYWYIGVNLKHSPLGDKRVRRAIAFTINREEVAAAAKWEAATPNDGPIPSSSFYYADIHPFLGNESLDKAKELMKEAGYPDGFKADIMVTNFYPETVRSALALQSEIKALGIELEVRVLEWGTWLQEEGAGNFDLYVLGWIGNLDPDDYFYAQHHTGEVFNFTGYSNPEVDSLLDQGRQATDPEKRFEIYKQVQDLIINDAPYIYLYIPKVVQAWQPSVQGYVTRSDEAVRFVDTFIKN